MQKAMTMFKSVINGVENFFHFDSTCSTDIAKMALLEALKWIGQIEDGQKAQIAQQAADAKASAPVEEEVSSIVNPIPDIQPIVDVP
jgi:hypothetical protein